MGDAPLKIWFHGTDEKSARSILSTGFRAGTYYAIALEDALEFGGQHVFEVALKVNRLPDQWQIAMRDPVLPDGIISYKIYKSKTVVDYPDRRNVVYEANRNAN